MVYKIYDFLLHIFFFLFSIFNFNFSMFNIQLLFSYSIWEFFVRLVTFWKMNEVIKWTQLPTEKCSNGKNFFYRFSFQAVKMIYHLLAINHSMIRHLKCYLLSLAILSFYFFYTLYFCTFFTKLKRRHKKRQIYVMYKM